MITYREDGSHKRFVCSCLTVNGIEGVTKQKVVAHAKRVYHLALRIVFLCIDIVVAICGKESLHVIILRLVGHEEHIIIALRLQHRGNTTAVRRNRALHQVAEHKSRERIKCSRHTMVGMYACTIKACKGQRVMIKRVECWREVLLITKGAHQVGRQALHQDNHHIAWGGNHRVGLHLAAQHTGAIYLSLNAQPASCIIDSLGIRHKVQFTVLLTHIVEHTG